MEGHIIIIVRSKRVLLCPNFCDASIYCYIMCSSFTDNESIEEKARKVTVHGIADFLVSIKLDKYIPAFKEYDISGDVLVAIKSTELSELGVESALDKVKILVGFRRYLKGGVVKFSASKLVTALSQSSLEKYCRPFEQHGVDGDMLLYEDEELVRGMLKEIGIGSNLAITRIISKFKTFVSVR